MKNAKIIFDKFWNCHKMTIKFRPQEKSDFNKYGFRIIIIIT